MHGLKIKMCYVDDYGRAGVPVSKDMVFQFHVVLSVKETSQLEIQFQILIMEFQFHVHDWVGGILWAPTSTHAYLIDHWNTNLRIQVMSNSTTKSQVKGEDWTK